MKGPGGKEESVEFLEEPAGRSILCVTRSYAQSYAGAKASGENPAPAQLNDDNEHLGAVDHQAKKKNEHGANKKKESSEHCGMRLYEAGRKALNKDAADSGQKVMLHFTAAKGTNHTRQMNAAIKKLDKHLEKREEMRETEKVFKSLKFRP